MADHWLKEITEIEGVKGALLCTNKGEILEDEAAFIPKENKNELVIYLIRLISAYHLKKQSLKEVELIWPEFRVVIKNSAQFVIIAFCESEKILPLLRITLNVAIAHLQENKKFIKIIKKHIAEKTIVLRKGNLTQQEIDLISKLQ